MPSLPATTLRFLPSKVIARDKVLTEGYKAFVTVVGADPYTGRLDVEVRVAPLDLSSARTVLSGWDAAGGVVTVPPGVPGVSPGVYMTRVKPAGSDPKSFSNWAIILVDDRPMLPGGLVLGTTQIALPPPGAYMLFENRNAGGGLVGYTRIDVETSPCPLGGVTMRFSKTEKAAYWAPDEEWTLRWCLRTTETPFGRWTLSPGGVTYRNPFTDMGSGRASVSYAGNGLQGGARQSLLGGFADEAGHAALDAYEQPADMWLFYALLPEGNRVPQGLGATPRPVVDLAFGRPNPGVDIDYWHMAALAPTAPGAALRMRYVETGANILPERVNLGWSVIEDWEWRADGLIERITQWRGVPPLYWRGADPGTTDARLAVRLRLIDAWLPDAQALQLRLAEPLSSKEGQTLDLPAGGSYELLVNRADGKPYSGFIQVELTAMQGADGAWAPGPPQPPTLWRDVGQRPIYVSNGRVGVSFAAHGIQSNFGAMLRARPYLTNASVNALYERRDRDLMPNPAQAPFSNMVALTIGSDNPIEGAGVDELLPV